MKTARTGVPSNVVNGSFTMTFQSVQRGIRATAHVSGRRERLRRRPRGDDARESGNPAEHGIRRCGSALRRGARLDLAHLSRQCFGDKSLEIELLLQFRIQSLSIATQSTADLAHRLRGSALAIGAGKVARAAATVEERGRAGGHSRSAEMARAISDLRDAVTEAVVEIDRLRA